MIPHVTTASNTHEQRIEGYTNTVTTATATHPITTTVSSANNATATPNTVNKTPNVTPTVPTVATTKCKAYPTSRLQASDKLKAVSKAPKAPKAPKIAKVVAPTLQEATATALSKAMAAGKSIYCIAFKLFLLLIILSMRHYRTRETYHRCRLCRFLHI